MEQLAQLTEIEAEQQVVAAQLASLQARAAELSEMEHRIRRPAVVAEALRACRAAVPPDLYHQICAETPVPRVTRGFVVLDNGAYCDVVRGDLGPRRAPMYFANPGYETWFQVGDRSFETEYAFLAAPPATGDGRGDLIRTHLPRQIFVSMLTGAPWSGERFADLEKTLRRVRPDELVPDPARAQTQGPTRA